jgi:hypothetical protein
MKRAIKHKSSAYFSLGMTAIFILLSAYTMTLLGQTKNHSEDSSMETWCFVGIDNSDAKAFRYCASGISKDKMIASKKAKYEARSGLMASINSVIDTVNINFFHASNYKNKEELVQYYEDLCHKSINQSIVNATFVSEHTVQLPTGEYKNCICMELIKSKVCDSIYNGICIAIAPTPIVIDEKNQQQIDMKILYERIIKAFEKK